MLRPQGNAETYAVRSQFNGLYLALLTCYSANLEANIKLLLQQTESILSTVINPSLSREWFPGMEYPRLPLNYIPRARFI